MKSFLLAFLLCVSFGIVTTAQDSPNPAPQKHQASGIRLTSVMGTVREGGEKLTFVTDQRASLECGQSGDPQGPRRTLRPSEGSRLPGRGLDSHH